MTHQLTTIKIEVLSEGPYEYHSLHRLAYDTDEGPCSAKVRITGQRELTEDELIAECERQHTEPEFFLVTE